MASTPGRGRGQAVPGRNPTQHTASNRTPSHGGGAFHGSPSAGRGISNSPGGVPTPSAAVKTLEDNTFNQHLSLQNLSISGGLPKRPGYGTIGKPTVVCANYFNLIPQKNISIHKYSVKFLDPRGGDPPKGRKLFRCMELLHRYFHLRKPDSVFTDFKATLISMVSLGPTFQEHSIQYFSEFEGGPNPNAPHYTASIKWDATLEYSELHNYLNSPQRDQTAPDKKEEIVQALNIIVGHGLKADQNALSRGNQHYPIEGQLSEAFQLGTGLKAFRGYFASVRPATGGILLNVQVKHIATYEVMLLLELLSRLGSSGTQMSFNNQDKFLKGLRVLAGHITPPRQKTIAGLARPMSGVNNGHQPQVPYLGANAIETKFFRSDTQAYISVAEYFKQQYRPLNAQHMPVVNVTKQNNPAYLPAEVCMIIKGQPFGHHLSPAATAKMIQFAVRVPDANAKSIINNGISVLSGHSENNLNKFGFNLGKSLIAVNARILQGLQVYYHGQKQARVENASWNFRSLKLIQAQKLPQWSFLWIRIKAMRNSFAHLNQVQLSVQKFEQHLKNVGIQPGTAWSGQELMLNDPSEVPKKIEDLLTTASKNLNLLLVILPCGDSGIYNVIKQCGDIKLGLHTVCVLHNNFARDDPQTSANVALKVNLKLGGLNHCLSATDLSFLREGNTMLIGLDVTHPSPGSSENAPSLASIVASVDNDFGQWPADIRVQTSREEMIEALGEMFLSRLQLWKAKNNKLPLEIIVYRDGVSEGQYGLVLRRELPQLRNACAKIYPSTAINKGEPYVTIIICGKRHNTRFYSPSFDGAKFERTKNGTIVDRGVTESRIWDFYLQAHTAFHGTPRPAHYTVIHDEIFFRRAATPTNDNRTRGQRAADSVQALTHSICYIFGRATKAVSLCPPAYYADLACGRARRWLSDVFEGSTTSARRTISQRDVTVHNKLRNTMFYM